METTNTLDISYSFSPDINYRISVSGIDNINKYVKPRTNFSNY